MARQGGERTRWLSAHQTYALAGRLAADDVGRTGDEAAKKRCGPSPLQFRFLPIVLITTLTAANPSSPGSVAVMLVNVACRRCG